MITKKIEKIIEKNDFETARKLLKMNLSVEQVSEGTGLSLDEVRKIAEEI